MGQECWTRQAAALEQAHAGRRGHASARLWTYLSFCSFLASPLPLRRRGFWLQQPHEGRLLRPPCDEILRRVLVRALCAAVSVSEAPMQGGNEASATNLVLVELLVPVSLRAPPVARAAPSSTPLRCCSISFGRSASCIPFPSFASHPHTAARVHLAHSPPRCCPSYTRSLAIIYCLDVFPFSRQPTQTKTPAPTPAAI